MKYCFTKSWIRKLKEFIYNGDQFYILSGNHVHLNGFHFIVVPVCLLFGLNCPSHLPLNFKYKSYLIAEEISTINYILVKKNPNFLDLKFKYFPQSSYIILYLRELGLILPKNGNNPADLFSLIVISVHVLVCICNTYHLRWKFKILHGHGNC